jgi:hypothetical protein
MFDTPFLVLRPVVTRFISSSAPGEDTGLRRRDILDGLPRRVELERVLLRV